MALTTAEHAEALRQHRVERNESARVGRLLRKLNELARALLIARAENELLRRRLHNAELTIELCGCGDAPPAN